MKLFIVLKLTRSRSAVTIRFTQPAKSVGGNEWTRTLGWWHVSKISLWKITDQSRILYDYYMHDNHQLDMQFHDLLS